MGYKPPKQQYNIAFEDYPGMEVLAKSVPLAKMNAMSSMQINHREQDEAKRLQVFRELAKYIIRWNLVHPEPDDFADDGETCAACGLAEDEAMPVSVQSLLCLEIEVVSAILTGWIFTIARASLPKGMSSSDGGMSGPSIPLSDGTIDETMKMLALLQNPVTLPTPSLSSD